MSTLEQQVRHAIAEQELLKDCQEEMVGTLLTVMQNYPKDFANRNTGENRERTKKFQAALDNLARGHSEEVVHAFLESMREVLHKQ